MAENGSIKIAITTNDLVQVDANFASARQIVLYSVTADSSEFLDCLQFKPGGKGSGAGKGPGGGKGGADCWMMEADADASTVDRMQMRIDALEGCAILFTLGLSDLQAVNIKGKDVFPIKMERNREIPEVIEYVQRMLTGTPPLWIRRALNGGRKVGLDYSLQHA